MKWRQKKLTVFTNEVRFSNVKFSLSFRNQIYVPNIYYTEQ